MAKIEGYILMVGNKCFTYKLRYKNVRYERFLFFFKRKISNIEMVLVQCNPDTVARKINCWS